MENIDLWLLEGGACILFAVSMATDLRSREIPNAVPVLLVALFAAYAFTDIIGSLGSLWPHLLIGVILLGVGFALYLMGSFGAGDGKLLGQVREVLDNLVWRAGAEAFVPRPFGASYSRSSSSLTARI